MSSVSLPIHLELRRKTSGTIKMPTTNQSTRKKPSFKKLCKSSVPSNWLLTAIAESITMSKMPKMSSKMSTPSTTLANFFCRKPNSSRAL